ncbi:hypothetical protein EV126DRAFT_163296 [Verticillium dahliae]|nr:hypothetical protein EV126DRAFT_163296 [Verticillium dahliae]
MRTRTIVRHEVGRGTCQGRSVSPWSCCSITVEAVEHDSKGAGLICASQRIKIEIPCLEIQAGYWGTFGRSLLEVGLSSRGVKLQTHCGPFLLAGFCGNLRWQAIQDHTRNPRTSTRFNKTQRLGGQACFLGILKIPSFVSHAGLQTCWSQIGKA